MKVMHKNMRRILSGFLAVIMMMSYIPTAAYATDEVQQTATHKVTFVADGTVIVQQEIADGQSAVEPYAPLVKGKMFTGWDKSFNVVTGDLTVTAVYADIEAAEIRIEYVFQNGSIAAAAHVEQAVVGAPFEVTVPSPEVSGFVTEQKNVTVQSESVPQEGILVRVVYEGTPKNYTVRHQFEQPDGSWAEEEEILTGTVNLLTNAQPKERTGYTAEPFEQQKVAADGETVVIIKYVLDSYTLVWYTGEGGTYIEPRVLRAGSAIELPANPSKAGYVFDGWENLPEKMPEGNVTVSAKWIAATEADYKVVYWGENLSGGWDYLDMETGHGRVGQVITYKNRPGSINLPDWLDANGFELNAAQTGGNVQIAADGTAVKNVYFNRKTFTIQFYEDKGWLTSNWQENTALRITAKYGEDISKEWETACENAGWGPSKNGNTQYTLFANMPAQNLTMYEKSAGSGKNIEYRVESINGGGYEVHATFHCSSGVHLTSEDQQPIEGFTYNNWQQYGSPLWLYYTRNSYTIHFANCTGVADASVKFEASIAGAKPADNAVGRPVGVDGDYRLVGWYTSPACEEGTEVDWNSGMPSHNLVVYAKWEAPRYTVSFETNHEDLSFDKITVDKYDMITEEIPVVTTEGFLGWYRDAELRIPFVETQKIVSDLTLYAKWEKRDRVYYILKVVDEKGTVIDEYKIYAEKGTYVTIEAPERPGYAPDMVSQQIFVDRDGIEVSFTYTKAENWSATVHHYLEGTETSVPGLEDEVLAIEGDEHSRLVYSGSVSGYEVVGSSYVQTVTRANAEVTFYYKEIPNPQYTVRYMLNDGKTELAPAEVKQDVAAGFAAMAASKEIPGYTYLKPEQEIPTYVKKDGTTVVTFTYKANENTKYTVIYEEQNIEDDQYTKVSEEEKTGVTGQKTQVAAPVKEGMTVQPFAQETIQGDGSTVVTVRYNRNTYKLTYTVDEDKYQEGSVKYGASIEEIAHPADKAGYTFHGWYGFPEEGTMPARDVTVTGTFVPDEDTVYTVIHRVQNADDNGYTDTVETKTGTTGAMTEAKLLADMTGLKTTFDPAAMQQPIKGDGSTEVVIVYTREEYTLTYVLDGEEYGTETHRYGATVTVKEDPKTEAGYTFSGWKNFPKDGKMPAENREVTGTITANTDTKYTVVHMLQNADNDEYKEYSRIPMAGTTGEQTEAEAINIPYASTQLPVKQETIGGDGKTEVVIYYQRDMFTLSYKVDGQAYGESKAYRHGASVTVIPEPKKDGYTFSGWEGFPADGKMPAENTEVIGSFKANEDTKYTVIHRVQNTVGNGYTDVRTDELFGTTDSLTQAQLMEERTGLTTKFNPEKDQVKIAGDGSTVVVIVYDRESYALKYVLDGKPYGETETHRYGAALSVKENPAVPAGYTFQGWNNFPNNGTMPNHDVTVYGTTEANTNTQYTVIHKVQNADDDAYTEDSREVLYGTTDMQTNAAAKTIPAATAQPFEQKTIAGDGTTVVEIYYNRNTYTLSYTVDGEAFGQKEEYRHGATLTIAGEPTREGYTFSGWTGVPADGKMPAQDLVVAGSFKANPTTYQVVYLFQNTDGKGYTQIGAAETRPGVTDETTAVTAPAQTGFTAQTVTQQIIRHDGSTVVEVRYDRNQYTLTYQITGDIDATEEYATKTYFFGADVDKMAQPEKIGYHFVGWTGEPEGTMPADNLTVTGYYEANINTAYTVIHMLQNADDDGYSEYRRDTDKVGTTGEWTKAEAIAIPGAELKEEIQQEMIAGDGSTVVVIRYDRLNYTVSYELDGEAYEAQPPVQYRYGKSISVIADPADRAGYTFSGWQGFPADGKMPANDVVVTGSFIANKDTKYTVRHMLQNAENDEYTLYLEEIKAGVTDEPTKAEAIAIPGAVAKKFEQETIAGDGSTVVVIEYDRISYNLIYQITGTVGVNDHYAKESYRYGATVKAVAEPVLKGYTFSGWSNDPAAMPAGNVTVTGFFIANQDTAYTVKHMVQNIEGEGYSLYQTDKRTGTTDELTNAAALTLTGMTAQAFEQQKIAADGSTVIEIHYTRNQYTVTYQITGTVGANAQYAEETYRYGAAVAPKAVPTKAGYEFIGWENEPAIMPAENVTVTGHFTARTDTAYTVRHMVQNANDNGYTQEGDDVILRGTTDEMTAAEALNLTGMTAQAFSQKKIAADGSTVIEIYYNRNQYTVTYQITGTVGANERYAEATYRYGATLVPQEVPSRVGYEFVGWTNEPATMPAENVTVTGHFTARTDTVYTVRHMVQNVNNDRYTQEGDDVVLRGTTDEMTAAEALSLTGMTAQAFSQKKIEADGSTVVEIYYNRNQYTVTYQITGTVGANDRYAEAAYRYGAAVTAQPLPIQAGYTFEGWMNEPVTMPAENVTVTGHFTARTDTVYTVRHMVQNANDDRYVQQGDDVILHGTTDTMTAAEALNLTGMTVQAFEQKTITGNGTTVVEIYYNRNIYTVTYQVDGQLYRGPIPYRYGATVAPQEAPARVGYTFGGWTNEPATMPAQNVVVAGRFAANTATEYTVRYFIQNVDNDGYTMAEEEVLRGTTDTLTNVQAPVRTGMTALAVEQKNIEGDGSTVVDVYYNRNEYTVTYRVTGEIDPSEESAVYRYGAAVPARAIPVREGYTFVGWTGERTTMPEEDYVVTGYFAANVYSTRVEIYLDEVYSAELSRTEGREFGMNLRYEAAQTLLANGTVYALIRVENNGLTVAANEEQNVIRVFYGTDTKGQEDPENPSEDQGDGEPDMYQTVFRFVSGVNGSVAGITYETYTDMTHTSKPVASPRAAVTVTANPGYVFASWVDENGRTYANLAEIRSLSVEEDMTFTAQFAIPTPTEEPEESTPVPPEESTPNEPEESDPNESGQTPIVDITDPGGEELDDPNVPLTDPSKVNGEHQCCILHFLLLLLAFIIELFYIRSVEKNQKKTFGTREEIAEYDAKNGRA